MYKENKTFLQTHLKGAFDITQKEITIKNSSYYLCFINSLSDSDQIIELCKGLYQGKSLLDIFALYVTSATLCNNTKECIDAILSGQCALLYENEIYLIETRSYPNQNSNEASNEQSIRGSHDSFVENIILNVGLIRRRIRDEKLRIQLHKIGNRSKCDIALIYVEDVVDKHIVDSLKNKINKIKNVDILYERQFVDAIYGKSINPYPSVRFCERPDICCVHLIQGYVVVLVDNSFTSIILPTTFFEMTKQIEEYTQVSTIGFFIRIIRLLAIYLSIYLLPFWLLVQQLNNPTILNIPLLEIKNTAFLLFEVFTLEIIIEWIRLSFIHTPQSISGIMGFLFVFLLGESAIQINVYTEVVLILVVLCNVCNFVTPNYELSLANKVFRIFISLLTILFRLNGYIIGIFIHYVTLLYTRNESYGYLYPFIPFDYNALKRLFLGSPIQYHKQRNTK